MEQLMSGKYTIGIATYENAGGRAALKVLKKLFAFSGARNTDTFIEKLPFHTDPLANPKARRRIKKKANNLYKSAQDKSSHSLINQIIHFILTLGFSLLLSKR